MIGPNRLASLSAQLAAPPRLTAPKIHLRNGGQESQSLSAHNQQQQHESRPHSLGCPMIGPTRLASLSAQLAAPLRLTRASPPKIHLRNGGQESQSLSAHT